MTMKKTIDYPHHCCLHLEQWENAARSENTARSDIDAELFHILTDESNYPIIFHCSHGVHRTGTAAALILNSLGVPWATIKEDYMLSNEYRFVGRIR